MFRNCRDCINLLADISNSWIPVFFWSFKPLLFFVSFMALCYVEGDQRPPAWMQYSVGRCTMRNTKMELKYRCLKMCERNRSRLLLYLCNFGAFFADRTKSVGNEFVQSLVHYNLSDFMLSLSVSLSHFSSQLRVNRHEWNPKRSISKGDSPLFGRMTIRKSAL